MIKWLISFILVFMVSTVYAEPEPIVTESTSKSTITTKGDTKTTVISPPPSAIAPQLSTNSNSDLCTIGIAGAVQTQILGVSAGSTFTEKNCLRLKNAKTLYDMGMKVAAVSVMCQDEQIFDAMMMAGTPCPYDGKIGPEAKIGWESHEEELRQEKLGEDKEIEKKTLATGGLGILAALLFLL